ncbi:ATP-binding domain-containing protein [Bacillus cereus group sp. Bc200]|uniref:DEAD/DEAH box helicase n=1 Tax=Bacillus cereus group sp. Bc200 TaxID=3018112 RepID=UPI0022E136B2|nr:ATP-binding domain-containing protein [Bacillus cereus group sp. Bc200]MDA2261062.1 ATP-binding domain-containing protein [Bacillus cereus group sp. Bc200]
MKKNILSQQYYNDTVSQKLIEYIENNIEGLDDATVYYQYPMIRELDDKLRFPSVLVVSPNHGVLLFKCDGVNKQRHNEISYLGEELVRIEDLIFSRLIKSTNKKLKKGRRDLSFNLCSALYIPNFEEDVDTIRTDVELLVTNSNIKSHFTDFQDEIDQDVLKEIYSIIENSTAIVKPKERRVEQDDTSSKAYILKKLEEEIATFDESQKYAALSQLEGPQRIRGLAGSGKTIILCMKAAILHLKYPDKKILYTFMTKSLYDYIELLITRFYKVLGDGKLPDFQNGIQIMHAWGGENIRGVYYDCCKRNRIEPIKFSTAARAVGGKEAFNYICKNFLEVTQGRLEEVYDFVLMDEAQDFKPSFYQICRAIVRNDCIVWGYDDLQNIFDVHMQDTVSTFENEYGAEGIDLHELQKNYPDMDNDIVLSKCYRNPKEILVTAHALGFGVNNDKLIQSLENNSHWKDLGYRVIEGDSKDGDRMLIERMVKNSPLSISQHQTPEEIIQLYSAESYNEEIKWICDSIETSVTDDGLRPDDIVVICLDDRHNRTYFNSISEELYTRGIYTHNLSSNSYEKGFIEDECVTLSTVYKAKGHEAAMVFVIGCDVFESSKDDKSMRNKVFTAFTRAKAWLRISGMKIENQAIYREVKEIIDNNFVMDFIYKEAHIIQRDLMEDNVKKAKLRESYQEWINELRKEGYSKDEINKVVEERQREVVFEDDGSDKE